MADLDAGIKLTLETGNMDSELALLISSIDKLTNQNAALASSFDKAEEAAKKVGQSASDSADGLEKHAKASEHVSEGHKGLVEGASAAADGFRAMGLEAGVGADAVYALTDAFRSFQSVGLGLVGIGVGIAGLSLGFLALKDAIGDAAAEQYQMVSIGALLKNQGGDWENNAKAVDDYAESLAKASVFAKGDLLQGMHEMLAAGMSFNDTMASQKAAMDLSIATGHSLVETEQALAMAYDGNERGLKRLGLVTAEEVKTGLDYDTILQRIEARMGGSAAAAMNTMAGAGMNLHNNFELLSETFGQGFEASIANFEQYITKGVKALQPLADSFKEFVTQHTPAFEAALKTIGGAFGQLVDGALPVFVQALENGMLAAANFVNSLNDAQNPLRQLAADVAIAWDDLNKFVDLITGSREGINAFFAVTFGVVAVQSLGNTVKAFNDLKTAAVASDIWSGMTLVVEAFAGAGGLGALIPALKAATVGFWDLYESEVVASGGIMLAVGLVTELILHFNDLKDALDKQIQTTNEYNADLADSGYIVDTNSGMLEDNTEAVDDNTAAMIRNAASLQKVLDQRTKLADALSKSHYGDQDEEGDEGSQGPGADDRNARNRLVAEEDDYGSAHYQIAGTSAGKDSSYDPPDKLEMMPSVKAPAGKDDITAYLDNMKDKEAALKTAMDQTTTSEAYQAAAQKYLQTEISDAAQEVQHFQQELNTATAAQTNALNADNSAIKTVNDKRQALNDYNQSLKGSGPLTDEQKQHQRDLEQAVKDAEAAQKSANTTLSQAEQRVRALSSALEAAKGHYRDLSTSVDEANAKIERSAEEFYRKTAQQFSDDLATAKMTEAQKYEYYYSMFLAKEALAQQDLISNKDRRAEDEASAEQYDTKRLDSYKAMDQQITELQKAQVEANKKAQEEAEKDVEKYLDDILTKHKSLRDELKDIYAQIQQNIIKTFAQEIVTGKGDIGGNFLSSIGIGQTQDQKDAANKLKQASDEFQEASGITKTSSDLNKVVSTTDQTSTQQFGTGATKFNAGVDKLTAAIDKMGSSSSPSSDGGMNAFYDDNLGAPVNLKAVNSTPITDGNVPTNSVAIAGTDITPNVASSAATGVSTAGTDSSYMAGSISMGVGDTADTSDLNFWPTPQGGWATSGSGVTTGTYINDAMQGAMIGGIVSGVTGGNSTWGSVGGALGGIAAAVTAANPLAGLGLEIGGSLLGQIFGSHETAQEQPDISNTQTYGQDLANWQGATPTVNGQVFTAASQYYTANGGTAESTMMENWAKSVANNQSTLTAAQKTLYNQIMQITGGNLSADIGIANEHQGVFTLGDGQTISVTALEAMQQSYEAIGSSQNTYSITRNAPNYNQAIVNPWTAAAASAAITASGSGSNVHNPVATPIVNPLAPISVHVTVNGSVVGTGGIQELTNTITQQIAKNQSTGYANRFVTQ